MSRIVSRSELDQEAAAAREENAPEKPARHNEQIAWASILGYTIDLDSASEEGDNENKSLQPDNDGDIELEDADKPTQETEKEGVEVEFRLFAPTKKEGKDGKSSSDGVQKFILPPSPPPEDRQKLALALAIGGKLDELPEKVAFTEKDVEEARARHRPQEYYLTPPLEDGDPRTERIKAVAVEGEEVLRGSKERWAGCEVPWRVTKWEIVDDKKSKKEKKKTKEDAKSTTVITILPVDREKRKRHRPNKKRRIILRKRRVADENKPAKNVFKAAVKKKNKAKAAATAKAVQQVHKRTEEEDREKRTRLNRLKKVRKKQKQKDKATAGDAIAEAALPPSAE